MTDALTERPEESRTEATRQRALPRIVQRGRVDYRRCLEDMRVFTAARTSATPDELWLVQHDPVYTIGIATRVQHLPRHGNVPIERSDRGGQITYHGPGQPIVYCLLDLRRLGLTVGMLVKTLEQAVIDLLAEFALPAQRRVGAPGVYVGEAKIAALGLRIRRGCSYHGVSFNVAMDLQPFEAIDPCGYPGLRITQAADHGISGSPDLLGLALARRLAEGLRRQAL